MSGGYRYILSTALGPIYQSLLRIYLLRAGAPEQTGVVARVAAENHGHNEDQGADGAGLPLQEEAGQVEHDEHHMVVQQCWVHLR